jgi:hypothetical protein
MTNCSFVIATHPGVLCPIRLCRDDGCKGMMAARIVHFGVDMCHRLGVLRRAGYQIEECGNLTQVRTALQSEIDVDAVIVNDCNGRVPLKALSIARDCTAAPIVLFPNSARMYPTETIDLVVPSLTPPDEWLLDLTVLIARSKAIRGHSIPLRPQRHSSNENPKRPARVARET